MFEVGPTSIRYSLNGGKQIRFPLAIPDWHTLDVNILILRSPKNASAHLGFDAWGEQFPRDEEITLIQKAIQRAKRGQRTHIRGISLADSTELLAKYYIQKGYKDALDRYNIPSTELLTVSISLKHFLFCDKDKIFLCKKGNVESKNDQNCPPDKGGNEKGANLILRGGLGNGNLFQAIPPLRTSHDLRALQQAVRMGIIPMIEVSPGDEQFLPICLQKELIPLFQLGQVCYYNWEIFFSGRKGIMKKTTKWKMQ